ncbi:unnamed protein product [Schistocephalus solidus]|uniref:Uncharacterized protein n=1 Tax=Schistocephalus solidus TaxID=70667 RepID=A0A183THY3_SCHSO|nr:unnamed protein product [Schistocephalus solidus]
MPQAGIEPVTTNAMATLVNHSTTSSRRRVLSQINIHAIDGTAIVGGCQKLSMKLNQLKDEKIKIKYAFKGASNAVDFTQESTERLTRSKTINTQSKGIPKTTLAAATATAKQFAMAEDKNSLPKTKNF